MNDTDVTQMLERTDKKVEEVTEAGVSKQTSEAHQEHKARSRVEEGTSN